MNTALLIYLMGIVDGFSETCGLLAGLTIVGGGIFSLMYYISNDPLDDEQTLFLKKLYKKLLLPFVILTAFAILTPSSKTIAAMYIIPRISENEKVTQLPDKVLTVMNKKLDEWILSFGDTKKDSK